MTKYLYYSNRFPSTGKKRYLTNILSLFPSYTREWIWSKLATYHNLPAGLNHNKSHQMRLIHEALALGRIPVLKPFLLNCRHNFGYKVASEWESFYDLSSSYVRYKDNISRPLDYIREQDFFKLPWKNMDGILRIRDRDITSAENNKYQLIVREGVNLFLSAQPAIFFDYQIILMEQQYLREIGNEVVQKLGKFYAMHYRAPDKGMMPTPRYLNLPTYYRKELSIEHLTKKLISVFPPQHNLYVLANIWHQPDYFRQLEKHYRIFRYYDFPKLRSFIEASVPNTFILFVIEQYIWGKALKRYQVRWRPSRPEIM